MKQIKNILSIEFNDIDLDRKVFDAFTASPNLDVEELAEQIEVSPMKISSSRCRLQSRGLLINQPAT